jgi:hypothetical protein
MPPINNTTIPLKIPTLNPIHTSCVFLVCVKLYGTFDNTTGSISPSTAIPDAASTIHSRCHPAVHAAETASVSLTTATDNRAGCGVEAIRRKSDAVARDCAKAAQKKETVDPSAAKRNLTPKVCESMKSSRGEVGGERW